MAPIPKTLKLKAHQLSIAVGRAALGAVPYYSRWGLYPQAIFVVVTLIWFGYRPEWATQGPTVSMCFLAVAAIIMAVRGPDSTRIEGGVWVAISVCLFAAEMHFIAIDQKNRDREQAELRSSAEKMQEGQARSFKQLIEEGKGLFSSLAEEKALTAKNLEHITGGGGYCWLVPVSPLPVSVGGDSAHQGNNWWQLSLKNSSKVVLPTCDFRFMQFPTEEERRAGVVSLPPFLVYHFEKVPIIGRRYYRFTDYFIKGDRIYSGVIETPTRSFIEVIKFEPDPNDRTRYVPTCTVAEQSGKILENNCNPQ